jgi:hypothetical protein
MNERIRELAEQSLPASYLTNCPSALEKFAELIVRECIATVENISPGYKDYRNQIEDAFRGDCVTELKQHFGVE